MNGLPWQFRDPAFRFVPLYRGRKASYVSKAAWKAGGHWSPDLDEFFEHTGDIGVRLEPSRLVVIDADVVAEFVSTGATTMTMRRFDGREEIMSWALARGLEWAPTLVLETSGRPDGSHEPGLHFYYRQNERWAVLSNKAPAPHCQVLAERIARITPDFMVLRDLPIAALPYEWARALQLETAALPRHVPDGRDGDPEFAMLGVNCALTSVKGTLLRNGSWSESQANAAVMYINSLLDSPMDERRLEATVLQAKNWR